ncbi:MAG TPA: tetratricopeptide repeat protein, partial [Terriglobia bacterium]|nr:tetratricopeptide repeat protein [Terriglobia bacterium]
GGHWKRARTIVEPRAAANPNDALTAYLLSQVKLAFGDVDGALKLVEKAVELDGGKAAYHYQLGVVSGEMAERASLFSKAGWARRFKSEAEKAAELDAHDLDSRFGLLEFDLQAPRLMGGGKDKARAMADEIAKIDPVRGDLAEARLALDAKDASRQEQAYLKAVAGGPRDYEVFQALADFYGADSEKRYDLAERYARQAIHLEPGRVYAYSSLAVALAGAERWTDLDQALAEAEKNVPDDFTPYYQAGRTLLLGGKNLPLAEGYFRKYLSQQPEGEAPTLAHAHWRLGLVLEKEGRKTEAVSEVETALRLKPDLEEAKKDLKRLKVV